MPISEADLSALTADLLQRGLPRLSGVFFTPAETDALTRVWRQTLAVTAQALAEKFPVVAMTAAFSSLLQADGVAGALLSLVLPNCPLFPPAFVTQVETHLNGPKFADFLRPLISELSAALLAQATTPAAPLYNRVSLLRPAIIAGGLQDPAPNLKRIIDTVTRLENELGRSSKYNLVFLGPVSGLAVGDEAQVDMTADLRETLAEVLAQLNRLAANRLPAPYTSADRTAYLQTMIDDCDTIRLPYAQAGGSHPAPATNLRGP